MDDVRKLLKQLDSSLGVPLPERSYGESCELYTPEDPTSKFRHLMVYNCTISRLTLFRIP